MEEKSQREYGEALGRFEAVRRRRQEIDEDIARCAEQVHQGQMRGFGFREREIFERWIEAQRQLARQLQDELQRLAIEVEQRRQLLIKAMQDRTIMERLREREMAAYRQEEARIELRLFDEIAVRDYIDTMRNREKDSDPQERIAR